MHSMQQVEGKSGSVQPHKDLVKINEVKKGNNIARVIFARAKKFRWTNFFQRITPIHI